ncbi:MAG: histidine triad nucleotide-binding protein [Azospirillum brasilense]|nr:MAG: histidine triad nucleotide-binding protein [Azospirillum brasilense]
MSYDTNNVFAKILRGEIPAKTLYEDDYAVAFPDIAPSAPTHVLVIPKGAYTHYDDFLNRAGDAQIVGFFKAVRAVAQQLGVHEYRLITNNGESAGQSVHHFHVHILAGKKLGGLLPTD